MLTAMLVASGVAWALSITCPNRDGNLCIGTDRQDTMTGRDSRADDMRGKGAADVMRGRGGSDEMLGGTGRDTASGQDGPDTLSGGPGADTLGGGKGNDYLAGGDGPDALNGGSGDDTYNFGNDDWGDDTITDTSNARIDPNTGTPIGNFAQFGFPNPLTTGLTVNLNSSTGSPEVSNGTLTGTVNWSDNAIDGVYVESRSTDTTITIHNTINGNAMANQLVGKGGEKTISTINAGGGNDWISVQDFAGGDTVDCGGQADDQVFYDQGDTVKNCPPQ